MLHTNLQLFGGRGASSGGGGGPMQSESGPQGPATIATQAEHIAAIRELNDEKYPDGTYDLSTMKIVEYPDGYQVTFWQIGDNYTPQEYADRTNEFLASSSDGIAAAGKYGGSPEVSFHVSDLATAIALGKKYNQMAIHDWKTGDDIDTGGTGRRN